MICSQNLALDKCSICLYPGYSGHTVSVFRKPFLMHTHPALRAGASSVFCCSHNLHSTQDQHTLDYKDQQESGLAITSALARSLNERKKIKPFRNHPMF